MDVLPARGVCSSDDIGVLTQTGDNAVTSAVVMVNSIAVPDSSTAGSLQEEADGVTDCGSWTAWSKDATDEVSGVGIDDDTFNCGYVEAVA